MFHFFEVLLELFISTIYLCKIFFGPRIFITKIFFEPQKKLGLNFFILNLKIFKIQLNLDPECGTSTPACL